jgi:hypothetical protein
MPRQCSVCVHDQRNAIETALIAETPYRDIARQYQVSKDAVSRHKAEHLPVHLSKAKEAAEVAQADDLLTELKALRRKAYSLLLAAEKQGDIRTALAGIREARACLELLAELEGELDRRATVNVTLSPEWLQVRALIVQALQPFPEARIAVAERLHELEASNGTRN